MERFRFRFQNKEVEYLSSKPKIILEEECVALTEGEVFDYVSFGRFVSRMQLLVQPQENTIVTPGELKDEEKDLSYVFSGDPRKNNYSVGVNVGRNNSHGINGVNSGILGETVFYKKSGPIYKPEYRPQREISFAKNSDNTENLRSPIDELSLSSLDLLSNFNITSFRGIEHIPLSDKAAQKYCSNIFDTYLRMKSGSR